MRNVAGVALSTSAVFLLIVAVMLNSSALFYMSTAIIATLAASRLQAVLSVGYLHFERIAPEKCSVGEMVTVEIIVWSDRRIRRPLVTVTDNLPSRLATADRTSSLPIAPAFDVPIRTQYRFRPLRRGKFKWTQLTATGTDALGLVRMSRNYATTQTELLVVPNPLAIDMDLPAASGWGSSESEHGQARGAGIEPRGIREYVSGDSLRYVHWRSSARRGQLLVKEFETGSHAAVAFVIQRTKGSEIGVGGNTTLERMCSHTAYLTERMLKTGAQVFFPTIEVGIRPSASPHERQQEILATLAEIEPLSNEGVGTEALQASATLSAGSMIYILISTQDPELPGIIHAMTSQGIRVVVIAYDPNHFVTGKLLRNIEGAADDRYVGQLSNAGASVFRAPYQEAF